MLRNGPMRGTIKESQNKHTNSLPIQTAAQQLLYPPHKEYNVGGTYLGWLNGSQGIASQFRVNVSTAEIVDNNHIVSLITQVEGRWPSTKAISSKNNYLLGSGVTTTDTVLTILPIKQRSSLLRRPDLVDTKERRCGSERNH